MRWLFYGHLILEAITIRLGNTHPVGITPCPKCTIIREPLMICARRVLKASSGSYFTTLFNADFQNIVRHVP